jgi:glycosidase
VEERKQYYLHQFLSEQPDLNLRNEAVKASLKDVLTFWMLKGVDGFRVDAAAHLVESANLDQDEPGKAGGDGYDSLIHNLTTFQPETYELVAEWRALLDEFQEADTKIRSSFLKSTLVLIVEAYGTHNQTMSFYEYQGKNAAHMPFNMNLVNLKQGMKPTEIRNLIQDWMVNMPEEQWANWVVGNHDKSRIATRMGADWVNANSMLQLTLPGTAFVYYGDEIGMHDVDISWEDTQDPAGKRKGEAEYKKYSRDPERTPMQWSGEINAGFSTSTNGTWLPVATDYQERNVKAQLAHGAGVSNLEVFAQLSTLRQQPSFQWGVMEYAVVDDNVLSYVRQAEGFEGYLVAINYGSTPSTVNFHSASPKFVPPHGDVVAHTANFDMAARAADYNDGVNADLSAVFLKPTEGVVFRWTWGATDVKEE